MTASLRSAIRATGASQRDLGRQRCRATASCRFSAPLSAADRDPCRLRDRRLRRLHGVGGRGAGPPVLVFAVQVRPAGTTVELVGNHELTPLQELAVTMPAMRVLHARHPHDAHGGAAEEHVAGANRKRELLSGNICRCTGYQASSTPSWSLRLEASADYCRRLRSTTYLSFWTATAKRRASLQAGNLVPMNLRMARPGC